MPLPSRKKGTGQFPIRTLQRRRRKEKKLLEARCQSLLDDASSGSDHDAAPRAQRPRVEIPVLAPAASPGIASTSSNPVREEQGEFSADDEGSADETNYVAHQQPQEQSAEHVSDNDDDEPVTAQAIHVPADDAAEGESDVEEEGQQVSAFNICSQIHVALF